VGPHLLLSTAFPPAGGGVARMTGELARRYPPGGLLVSTAMHPDAADVDALFPSRVDRMPLSPRGLRTIPGILQWSRRAAMLAREHEASFVWCGDLTPATYAAKWVCERQAVPYGVLVHGADLLRLQHGIHRSALRRRTARAILRSAAVLVANSRYSRDLTLAIFGELGLSAADDPVRVVPLGTDPAFFRPGVDTAAVRARYGLGEGRWLLTVARLVPHKGVDVVIRALARLAPHRPDLGYLVVGRGKGLDALRAEAEALGVGERVRFVQAVPEADLPALYGACDVYVGASRRAGRSVEGFAPISVLEAAACGRPVVTGRSGGIPETVRHEESGLLVDAESPDEVAAAVEALLADSALAERLGREARRSVERFYNWDRVTGDLIGIAQELGGFDRVPGDA
jgi:phosphatidylinositol alpha-1,6-mannosyltransferase